MVRLHNPLRLTCRGNRALRCNGVGPLYTHDRHCTRTHPDWNRKTKSLWISNGTIHIKKSGSWKLPVCTYCIPARPIHPDNLDGSRISCWGQSTVYRFGIGTHVYGSKRYGPLLQQFSSNSNLKKSCWSPNATLHLKVSLWGQCQERTLSPLEKSSISGRKIFITREKTK